MIVKYTKEQKQKCADATSLSISSVNKYVSEYGFDASTAAKFKKAYDDHKLKNSKKVPPTDEETDLAKKQKIIAQARKEEALAEAAELKNQKEKGEVISIKDQEQYQAMLGLTLKTLLESVAKDLSAKLEGKKTKQISIILTDKVEQILTHLTNLESLDDE